MAKKTANKLGKAAPCYPADVSPKTYKPSKEEEARTRRYRAEDALRDIERAKQHEGDKSLMKDVKQLASEKIKALKAV